MKRVIVLLALTVILCGGCSQTAQKPNNPEPLIRIGMVADVQYADREPVPEYNSYYRPSVSKLEEFVDQMNSQELDFVIQLGDFVDMDVKSYDTISPVWQELNAPTKSVIGNHDMQASEDYDVVLEKLGMEKSYYDFIIENWRFVVLDTNEIGILGSKEGTPRHDMAKKYIDTLEEFGYLNALPWNSTVSDEQVKWLNERLELADSNGENVIVFGHHTIVSNAPGLNIWNSSRVIKSFVHHKSFKAYICGHHHEGSFVTIDDDYYLTMQAMMSTPDTNAYSIMELYPDYIKINGYGREPDRILPITSYGE